MRVQATMAAAMMFTAMVFTAMAAAPAACGNRLGVLLEHNAYVTSMDIHRQQMQRMWFAHGIVYADSAPKVALCVMCRALAPVQLFTTTCCSHASMLLADPLITCDAPCQNLCWGPWGQYALFGLGQSS
jgi:hypothetical protein